MKKIISRIQDFAVFVVLVSMAGILAYNLNYTDRLNRQVFEKDIIIRNLLNRDSVINEIFGLKTDSSHRDTSFFILDFKGLAEKINTLKDTAQLNKAVIDLVKRKYNIDYKIEETITNNRKSWTISVVSPTVDSALLLLPPYRNRITFDKEKNGWSVAVY